jgi:hypothetical protein
MMRKVMVLAIACLIPSRAGAVALTSCRSRRGAVRAFRRRRPVVPNSGCRPRRSVGRYLGASTAAPPITRPGISAASSRAAPASIVSPTVTYVFMASCRPQAGGRHRSATDAARAHKPEMTSARSTGRYSKLLVAAGAAGHRQDFGASAGGFRAIVQRGSRNLQVTVLRQPQCPRVDKLYAAITGSLNAQKMRDKIEGQGAQVFLKDPACAVMRAL